jgi:hypothetical protein
MPFGTINLNAEDTVFGRIGANLTTSDQEADVGISFHNWHLVARADRQTFPVQGLRPRAEE